VKLGVVVPSLSDQVPRGVAQLAALTTDPGASKIARPSRHDRARRLHVLPERAQVEAVEVVRELEVDVQPLAALERRVDGLHHLPILVARDLPGGAKAKDTCR
jgi:hypothetical protein